MANVLAGRLICRLFVCNTTRELPTTSARYSSSNILFTKLLSQKRGACICNAQKTVLRYGRAPLTCVDIKFYSDDGKKAVTETKKEKKQKLSIFQRFKQMYKEYWYVLVPVHLVTSAAWFGGFYYLAKSGVDVVGLLQWMHVSDRIVNPLKDSSMGYIAISYALYKIATPARYAVTLGGTTVSINYLKKWGYIKPVPSAERLKEMYQEKKDDFMEAVRETREGLKVQSSKLKDKKENMMDDLDKSIEQIREISKTIKTNPQHVVEEVKKADAKKGKK